MISKNAARPSILHVEGRLFHLRQFRSFVVSLWTPDLRLALLLCIPGVAVAIALRLWLLYHMPAGFVHGDTAQQLITPLTLLERGHFVVDSKKTFLTPLLYSISALAHIPVLYFAAAVQQATGNELNDRGHAEASAEPGAGQGRASAVDNRGDAGAQDAI